MKLTPEKKLCVAAHDGALANTTETQYRLHTLKHEHGDHTKRNPTRGGWRHNRARLLALPAEQHGYELLGGAQLSRHAGAVNEIEDDARAAHGVGADGVPG
jgi:hypothetical protein